MGKIATTDHPPEAHSGPALLNVSEAGESLGVSVSTVWRMIRRGDLASVRQGGRRLIPADKLQARVRARQDEDLALRWSFMRVLSSRNRTHSLTSPSSVFRPLRAPIVAFQ